MAIFIYKKERFVMNKLKNILAENMRRFGTKNLSEQNLEDLKNKLGFDSGANRDPRNGNLIDTDANNNGYPDDTDGTESVSPVQSFIAKLNAYNQKTGQQFFNTKPVTGKVGTGPGYIYNILNYWRMATDRDGNFAIASYSTPNEEKYFYSKEFPEFLEYFNSHFKNRI